MSGRSLQVNVQLSAFFGKSTRLCYAPTFPRSIHLHPRGFQNLGVTITSLYHDSRLTSRLHLFHDSPTSTSLDGQNWGQSWPIVFLEKWKSSEERRSKARSCAHDAHQSGLFGDSASLHSCGPQRYCATALPSACIILPIDWQPPVSQAVDPHAGTGHGHASAHLWTCDLSRPRDHSAFLRLDYASPRLGMAQAAAEVATSPLVRHTIYSRPFIKTNSHPKDASSLQPFLETYYIRPT